MRSVNASGITMTGPTNLEVNATERWPGCDCCKRYMHQDSTNQDREVNVSFAGCGFLGIYHLGVLRCFLTHGKPMLHRVKRWSGASAGALAAASIICIPNKLDVSMMHYFFLYYMAADKFTCKFIWTVYWAELEVSFLLLPVFASEVQ